MKKLLLPVLLIAAGTFTFNSCNESTESETSEEDQSKGPSLCECVNLDKGEADEELIETCENMEMEWQEKYDAASDEEKDKMRDEVQACEEEG